MKKPIQILIPILALGIFGGAIYLTMTMISLLRHCPPERP